MDNDATFISDTLVWAGAAITVGGLGLLVWCILKIARARRRTSDETALRNELQRVVPLNLGALFLSVIGLMMVVVGIILS